VATAAIAITKTNKQTKTAIPLGKRIFSKNLHNGKKRVAITAPIDKGIRKSLAKCNPAKTRNKIRSFFIIEEVVIHNSFIKCITNFLNLI
jgi:chorismate-pyruvate lyase